MLKKIRILLAVLSLMAVTALFLDFTGTVHPWVGWLAKIQFLPALMAMHVGIVVFLLVLTLVFGRIYCSVICPLGIFQDAVSWLGGKRKKNRFRYSPAKKVLRLTVLVLFVICTVAGLGSIAAWLAPYSAYGRMVSSALTPLWQMGNNLLAGWAEQHDSYAFYRIPVMQQSVAVIATALVTLVVLVVLAFRHGRTYCNTLCPVGTVLGYVARFSWLKPVIDTSRCNGCGLCGRNCKASCINSKEHQIDYTRCVACMDCLSKCKQGAIHYAHPSKSVSTEKPASTPQSAGAAPADASRRQFLTLTGTMAATAWLNAQEKTVDGGLAAITAKQKPARKTPLFPAGAAGQRNFVQHCTACQLCVSVCPNHVLHPSGEWDRLMKPEMSYEQGYCRPECTRCGDVCPAGAIRPFTVAQKSSVQVGHAVWVAKNCVVNTDGVRCGNCARHCPSGAILMVPKDKNDPESLQIPVVNTERCIGCGACEHLCPARPFSAIYVEGVEVHREI
jgi:polyferredoxin